MRRLVAIREHLRSSLWFIPLLFAVGAVVLAISLTTLDSALATELGAFGGTAEGARSVLSTIAQSMLSFTALVFTVTMLVLQLASNQLSPRVLRTFLRDRGNQVVLGIFVATFVYTLVVLRGVRTPVDGSPGFVPGLAVSVAFLLLLASVAAFIYYIDHMAHAIRATTVMDRITDETCAEIDRSFPDAYADDAVGHHPPPALVASDGQEVTATRRGVLVAVDEEALLELASTGGRAVSLQPAIGDYVVEGATMFLTWGEWDEDARDGLRAAATFDQEQSLQNNPGFGIRQLVDIALRALSSSTNDPTTAVQAVDRIDAILRRLATRQFPPSVRYDDAGSCRVWSRRTDWSTLVRLATEELWLEAVRQPTVKLRIEAMIRDVAAMAPAERRLALWSAMSRQSRTRRGLGAVGNPAQRGE